MSIFSSYKKIFLLGFIIVILIAIPLSVYIAQQRQQTKSKASASTTLSFEPAAKTISVGEILTLDIALDPGTGATANQVSFVKLSIGFDPTKFTADSLKPNTDPQNTLTSVLEDPVLTAGKATISLSVGADPTKVVTTKTKIAVLKLNALSGTEVNNPSLIAFDLKTTQILSIAASDQTSENVLNLLSTTTPATVTINPASTSLAPTSTPTPTLTPTLPPGSAPPPTPTSSPGGAGLSTGSAVFTPTPIVVQPLPTTIALSPKVILPPTGPGENILGIGILGAIFTIIGGALFILF